MDALSAFMFDYESLVRVAAFVGGMLLFGGFESLRPRQSPKPNRKKRWLVNYALTFLNFGTLHLVFPLLAVGAAIQAAAYGWGLFNRIPIAPAVAGLVGILLLDLVIYWQHRLFHRIPILWRLHRMHHSDTAIDVSTALRFHPLEIMLSMAVKMATVVILGVPPVAVIIFEALLNFSAMFNHANWNLGERTDRVLARVLVTPDLHRIHHSVRPEMHTNFGFFLSIWDRLFGTRKTEPDVPHAVMAIGLESWRGAKDHRLDRLLIQPLQRDAGENV